MLNAFLFSPQKFSVRVLCGVIEVKGHVSPRKWQGARLMSYHNSMPQTTQIWMPPLSIPIPIPIRSDSNQFVGKFVVYIRIVFSTVWKFIISPGNLRTMAVWFYCFIWLSKIMNLPVSGRRSSVAGRWSANPLCLLITLVAQINMKKWDFKWPIIISRKKVNSICVTKMVCFLVLFFHTFGSELWVCGLNNNGYLA